MTPDVLPALASDEDIAWLRDWLGQDRSQGQVANFMVRRVLARLDAAEKRGKVLREELDNRIAELEALMDDGQGEHGQLGYVQQATWNGWCGQVSAMRQLRGLMKTLDERAALEAKP